MEEKNRVMGLSTRKIIELKLNLDRMIGIISLCRDVHRFCSCCGNETTLS